MNYLQIQPLDENDWIEKRKQYITATQSVFAIKNFSKNEKFKELADKYCLYDTSLYQFYFEKTLTKEQQELYNKLQIKKDYFEAGKKMEEEVANIGFEKIKQENSEYQNATLIPNGRTIWTFEGANVMATPDYIIDNNGKKEILECKTTAYDISNTYYLNKLLNYYYFQVQHQLLCSGLNVAWLVICNKDKTGQKLTGNCKAHRIEKNENLFNTIIQASNDCIKWIQDTQSSNTFDLKPNLLKYNEVILDAINRRALKEYILQYKDTLLSLKNNEKIEENIITLCKSIAAENLIIEGINIERKITNNSYYTIENIDKDIEKKEKEIKDLQQIRDRVIKGENDIIKRKGSIAIKDIKSV